MAMRTLQAALLGAGLALSALGHGAGPAAADYYDGLRAYNAENIPLAIEEWRRSGLEGDVLAQNALGDLYREGIRVLQDYVEAHTWYNLAAVNLLETLTDASGRPTAEARKARDEAREARNRLQSVMTAEDIEAARRRFVRIFEAGGPARLYQLGGLYQRGAGVQQNSVEAYRYFVIAAANGVTEAIRARDILAANLEPEQVAAAQRAAREWSPPASPFEDDYYDGGPGGPGGVDSSATGGFDARLVQQALRVLDYYDGAIDGVIGPGSRGAMAAFQADIRAPATGRLSSAQAVKLIEIAAIEGRDRVSQNTLGSLYAEGRGKSRDYREARRWFEASAAQGFPAANYNLGILYRDGLGVGRDREQALVFFRRALNGGHPHAAEAIRDLSRAPAY